VVPTFQNNTQNVKLFWNGYLVVFLSCPKRKKTSAKAVRV